MDFVDERNYERMALTILKCVGNLRLVGDTGTAKTTLVHYLDEKYRWRLYEMSLNTDTSRWDLLASDVLEKGTTKVREGVVALWIKDQKPGIKTLYLSEYNYAQPNVTTLLNQLTDFRRSIWIPELQTEFKRSRDHYVVIDMNPYEKAGYSGTFQTNIAQMRRFESLRLEYLGPLRETQYIQGNLRVTNGGPIEIERVRRAEYELVRRYVEFANKTRTLYRLGKLSTPVTTGNVINYVALWEHGLRDSEIMEVVQGMYLEDEAQEVKRLFEGGGITDE